MNSTVIGVVSTTCMFGGALFGMWLKQHLPPHHLSADSRDVVKLGAGMIATLSALVLGLLVSSAKSSLDAINAVIMEASAKLVLLDRQLASAGPSAQAARDQLKLVVAAGVEKMAHGTELTAEGFSAFEASDGLESVVKQLATLTPRDEAQRLSLAHAQELGFELAQHRWAVIEQTQTMLPIPLLVALIVWLSVLFTTFGLFAPRNATVLVALLMSAASAAAAIFLVLEMNQPVSGIVRVSLAPLRHALEHLGK